MHANQKKSLNGIKRSSVQIGTLYKTFRQSEITLKGIIMLCMEVFQPVIKHLVSTHAHFIYTFKYWYIVSCCSWRVFGCVFVCGYLLSCAN